MPRRVGTQWCVHEARLSGQLTWGSPLHTDMKPTALPSADTAPAQGVISSNADAEDNAVEPGSREEQADDDAAAVSRHPSTISECHAAAPARTLSVQSTASNKSAALLNADTDSTPFGPATAALLDAFPMLDDTTARSGPPTPPPPLPLKPDRISLHRSVSDASATSRRGSMASVASASTKGDALPPVPIDTLPVSSSASTSTSAEKRASGGGGNTGKVGSLIKSVVSKVTFKRGSQESIASVELIAPTTASRPPELQPFPTLPQQQSSSFAKDEFSSPRLQGVSVQPTIIEEVDFPTNIVPLPSPRQSSAPTSPTLLHRSILPAGIVGALPDIVGAHMPISSPTHDLASSDSTRRLQSVYLDSARNVSTGFLDRRPVSGISSSSRALSTYQPATMSTSFTLMHAPGALSAYRQAAKKAKDPSIQFEFAKYLLDIAQQQHLEDQQDGNEDADAHVHALPMPRMPAADTASIHSNRYSMDMESLFGDDQAPSDERDSNSPAHEALYWYYKLARGGHGEAAHQLGLWLERGDTMVGLHKDLDKAARFFETGSKAGHADCCYKMGVWCESRKEYAKAMQFYTKACSMNHPGANARLGKALLFGEMKQRKSVRIGVRYLLRASEAATTEYNDGAYMLGMLQAGIHKDLTLPKDLMLSDVREGRRQLEKAAFLGHGDAQYRLGWAYEFGELDISVPDPKTSFQLYRVAAEENSQAEAMMGLSGWYLTGIEDWLPASEQLAFEWCQKSAAAGLPKAEYAMGYFYEVGIYVQKDAQESWRWYEMAVDHGSKDARRRLEKRGTYKARKRDYGTIKHRKKDKGKECSIM